MMGEVMWCLAIDQESDSTGSRSTWTTAAKATLTGIEWVIASMSTSDD